MIRFLGADPAATAHQPRAAIVGVPYDGAVTYRSGAREGPKQLRVVSVAPLLGRAIRNLHESKSLSVLFDHFDD